ncbi:hypothetical protein Esti_006393 [Eimeria stiedai]
MAFFPEYEVRKVCWRQFHQAYTNAVAETYSLLKASMLPLAASTETESERASHLLVMKEKAAGLVEAAAPALGSSVADFLKAYTLPVQQSAVRAQTELVLLRTAAEQFQDQQQQQAKVEAPPAELLQEALAVTQQASEMRLRVQSLEQQASSEGEPAAVAFAWSAASNLEYEAADLLKQSLLVRHPCCRVRRREAKRADARVHPILLAAFLSAMKQVRRDEALSFDEETQRHLTEGFGYRFAEAFLPSRRLSRQWQEATNEIKEAEKALEQAARLLVEAKDRSVMRKTADEALQQPRLVAAKADTTTCYLSRCSAWLKVEMALTRDNNEKASDIL